jgi:hypothetical protein
MLTLILAHHPASAEGILDTEMETCARLFSEPEPTTGPAPARPDVAGRGGGTAGSGEWELLSSKPSSKARRDPFDQCSTGV